MHIQNANGLWEEDGDRVNDIFLEGFEKLYRIEHISSPRIPVNIFVWGNQLSESEAVNLTLAPTDAKILFALNSMKAFKAPGPDGLYVGFFQRFWMVVGMSVKHEVKQIFKLKRIPPQLNKTLIALISKQLGPGTINHFHLISQCNTICKIVSNILALRMKHRCQPLSLPCKQHLFLGDEEWIMSLWLKNLCIL